MSRLDRTGALGMELRPSQGAKQALEVENCRYDPIAQSWTNDRGWCQYYIEDGTIIPFDGRGITSMGVFYRHQGAEEYILFEQKDATNETVALKYLAPQDTAGGRIVTLVGSGRSLAGNNDAGTNYVPMGDFCLIINGEDRPIMFQGGTRMETFGFHERPPSPDPQPPFDKANTYGSGDPYWVKQQDGTNKWAISLAENCSFGVISGPGEGKLTSADDENIIKASYQYAVSYISQTGSESPRSPLSKQAKFIAYSQNRYVIPLTTIPKGPDGTIKRRLYRTKNQGDGVSGAGATLYFLDDLPNNIETIYYDAISDSALGAEAPLWTASDIFPAGARYAATFMNRMFVGGGSQHPTRVFFSAGNAPEQFPTNYYFDLGGSGGGEVTGLFPYNDLMLVFRRGAIDAVVPTDSPDVPFRLVPVSKGVGTTATKSIVDIPGIGIIFLSPDGFYVLRGNLTNEQELKIAKISNGLGRYIKRISTSALGKAVGVYNAKDEEYWCHAPVDGQPNNTLGFVFHAPNGQWSMRTEIPASAFAVCQEGLTIFGSHSPDTNFPDVARGDANKGVFVWCGVDQWGYQVSPPSPVETYALLRIANKVAKPAGVWGSGWTELSAPEQLKKIQSVTLDLIDTGETLGGTVAYAFGKSVTPTFTYYTDWHDANPIATRDFSFGEIDGSSADRHRYGAVVLGDTAKFDNPRVIRKRVDLNMENGCKWFRFSVSAVSRFQLRSYTIQYTYVGERGNQTHVWEG